MSFQSLQQVLGHLKSQYPQREQHLRQILQHWEEIVGSVVATQTHPIAIHRGVLKVATSSAAWAQNLVFERQRILQKLNEQLSLSLSDIRFSSADWHTSQNNQASPGWTEQVTLWREHPSRVNDETRPASLPLPADPTDPLQVFQRWSARMKSRTRQLPNCPHCHCPTPPGELDRWQMCSLCAAKQWQR